MDLKDKMIKLVQPTALQSVFMQLNQGNNKIILWQSSETSGKRVSKHVRMGPVNSSQEEMSFYPQRGEFDFNPHSYIYFFGYRRTTIFKASILYHSRLKLIIKMPREVMLSNSRKEDRQDFSDATTAIHYTHNPKVDSALEKHYHQSKLIDLSATGLSFKSSLNNVLRFRKGDHLWIRSPLKETNYLVAGEIKYVTQVQDTSNREKYFRIGVVFID